MAILMEDTTLDAERFLTRQWAKNTPIQQLHRLQGAWDFAHRLKGKETSLSPVDVTLLVLEQLHALEAPYTVGGSVASSLYGEVRYTQSTDLVVDLDLASALQLAQALQSDFYVSEEAVRDAVARRGSFNLIHFDSQHKIDLFVSPRRAFEQSRLSRSAVPEGFPQLFLVSSPEDVLLAKFEWYRLGKGLSERQWRDILAISASQHARLDYDYVLKWARELKVDDLLQRAREEVSPLL